MMNIIVETLEKFIRFECLFLGFRNLNICVLGYFLPVKFHVTLNGCKMFVFVV